MFEHDATIYNRFSYQVNMIRKNEILIADEKEAVEFCNESGYCCVAVIPTIEGFVRVDMIPYNPPFPKKDYTGVYLLRVDYTKSVIFNMNYTHNDNERHIYNTFSIAIDKIRAMCQRLGDLCIARYSGDHDRMFLAHNLWKSVSTKSGWWDTFCLKNGNHEVQKDKRYLCFIAGFKLDKNGYINVIVDPFFELDNDDLIDGYIYWHRDYFVVEGNYLKMSMSVYSQMDKWNFVEASKIPFEDFLDYPHDPDIQAEIKRRLLTPTKTELDLQSLRKAANENPVIAKKMEQCGGLYHYAEIVRESYWNLKQQGYVPDAEYLGDKAVLCVEYYAKKKADEKAARKAAKEARKLK